MFHITFSKGLKNLIAEINIEEEKEKKMRINFVKRNI